VKSIFKFIIFIAFSCIVLAGCSVKNESFVIPVNYTGKANMKVYTDNTDNSYSVKIMCKDGDYSFVINEGSSCWSIDYTDSVCVLNNDKFTDSSVRIDNFNMVNPLIYEFDLNKFNSSVDPIPEELIYWDGIYKHVMKFNKENLLPDKIFIYKNDDLVKAIQYDEINIIDVQ
jgi:hypothetical protein